MFYELQRTMFAGTGYAAETGGRLKDLRELTVQTVRNYHKVLTGAVLAVWLYMRVLMFLACRAPLAAARATTGLTTSA